MSLPKLTLKMSLSCGWDHEEVMDHKCPAIMSGLVDGWMDGSSQEWLCYKSELSVASLLHLTTRLSLPWFSPEAKQMLAHALGLPVPSAGLWCSVIATENRLRTEEGLASALVSTLPGTTLLIWQVGHYKSPFLLWTTAALNSRQDQSQNTTHLPSLFC